ncbi:MAG: hypothetical protein RID09_28735 [Coleofasciculus sp. G1-WW12-02]|uniref:hypothetical protein n=1 Tax=unclassified Coleofasciculus TaxID=2692782 RepID=UPI0032F9BD75
MGFQISGIRGCLNEPIWSVGFGYCSTQTTFAKRTGSHKRWQGTSFIPGTRQN